MSSTKEKLLALRASVPSEVIEVPSVGQVEVRGLTAAGRDEWEQRIYAAKGKTIKNMRASLVCMCLYEDGKPMFDPSEIDAVGSLPAQIVDRLWDISTRLSGMGSGDKDELEKNCDSAR